MAYVSPTAKTTGDIVTAAHWNQDVVSNSQASVPDVFTAAGDLAYATAADTVARLAKGTATQILRMNSGAVAPEWTVSPELAIPLAFNLTVSSGSSESVLGYQFAFDSTKIPSGFTATFAIRWSATNGAGGTDTAAVTLRDITTPGDLWTSGGIAVPVTDRLDSNTVTLVTGKTYEVYATSEQSGQGVTVHSAVLRLRW